MDRVDIGDSFYRYLYSAWRASGFAYTEAVQAIVLVAGSAFVLFYGLQPVGGWGQLVEFVGPEMFNLWKPLVLDGVSSTWAHVNKEDQMM